MALSWALATSQMLSAISKALLCVFSGTSNKVWNLWHIMPKCEWAINQVCKGTIECVSATTRMCSSIPVKEHNTSKYCNEKVCKLCNHAYHPSSSSNSINSKNNKRKESVKWLSWKINFFPFWHPTCSECLQVCLAAGGTVDVGERYTDINGLRLLEVQQGAIS